MAHSTEATQSVAPRDCSSAMASRVIGGASATLGVSAGILDRTQGKLRDAINRVRDSAGYIAHAADRVLGTQPESGAEGEKCAPAAGQACEVLALTDELHAALEALEHQTSRLAAL